MAAYEVLLLNTAIPQIQAAQSGDTYVVPRDIAFSTVASFAAGAEATPSIVATGDTNTGIWFPAADTVAISTGGTSRLRLDASGNLGLGVTPSAWASGYRAIDISPTGAITASNNTFDAWGNAFFNGTNTLYKSTQFATMYRQEVATGKHIWFNAPSGTAGNAISFTQAMTLDASGRLGIGETNPTTRLYVKSSGGSGTAATLQTDASVCVLNFINTGTTSGTFLGSTGTALYFATDGAERARITSGGNLDLQKNIGLGGTAATTSGTGITFPATASPSSDANTLDDYEEGTFDPEISGAGGAPTITYGSERAGYYVKVGQIVTCWIVLSTTARTGGSGNLLISNLPFVANDGQNAQQVYAGSIGTTYNLAHSASYAQFGTRVPRATSAAVVFEFGTQGGTTTDAFVPVTAIPTASNFFYSAVYSYAVA